MGCRASSFTASLRSLAATSMLCERYPSAEMDRLYFPGGAWVLYSPVRGSELNSGRSLPTKLKLAATGWPVAASTTVPLMVPSLRLRVRSHFSFLPGSTLIFLSSQR